MGHVSYCSKLLNSWMSVTLGICWRCLWSYFSFPVIYCLYEEYKWCNCKTCILNLWVSTLEVCCFSSRPWKLCSLGLKVGAARATMFFLNQTEWHGIFFSVDWTFAICNIYIYIYLEKPYGQFCLSIMGLTCNGCFFVELCILFFDFEGLFKSFDNTGLGHPLTVSKRRISGANWESR